MGHIIDLITATREAIGFEVDLAIDCHGQFDVGSAITLAKAVEPLRLLWLEEPVPAENLDALAQVKASTSTVICTGENQYNGAQFLELLQKHACDVIMPDLAKAGGLMEAKRIADIADAFYVPIAPHNVSSPLGMMAACHVCAAVPNFLVLEFHGREIPCGVRPLRWRQALHPRWLDAPLGAPRHRRGAERQGGKVAAVAWGHLF